MLVDRDRRILRRMLSHLQDPVHLHLFLGEGQADRQAADVVASLTTLAPTVLRLHRHEGPEDEPRAQRLGILRRPQLAFLNRHGLDTGIRFLGPPSGYQFGALVEACLDVSTGRTLLSGASLDRLRELRQPLTITVYVSPTCPFCPRAVRLAHMMAAAAPRLQALAVDATVFAEEAQENGVTAVPAILIRNGVTGASRMLAGVPRELDLLDCLNALS
jgi:glutaredoxin-like protein